MRENAIIADAHDEEMPVTLETTSEQMRALSERQNPFYTEIMLKLQEIEDTVGSSVADEVMGPCLSP
jgi:hypothetical protein